MSESTFTHASLLETKRKRTLSLCDIAPDTALDLYKFMIRLRRCEDALIREYRPANEMRCPMHFCVGQEAVPAAIAQLLIRDDYLFSHHRSHGYFLAKGAPMRALFAELYGRETGANGGKAGSQDISMPSHNFYSGAILAGSIAISTGAAMGFQMQRLPNVAVAGFGEGATDEGIFWEAVNFAALRNLPVVFLCENNRYATYSHQLKRQAADNLSERVATFGVPSRSLFGNDAVGVYRVVREAIDRARSGGGPSFIEAYTYRWNGHVGPENDDSLDYRPADEVTFWKDNDPIALLEEQLERSGLLGTEAINEIADVADLEIGDAFAFAKSSPWPTDSDWGQLNYTMASPIADDLLCDNEMKDFDQNQQPAIPGPY